MPTWRRWANLMVLLMALWLISDADKLAGIIGFFAMIVFYIGLYSLFFVRGGKPTHVPLGAVPIAYVAIKATPALEYVNAKMALRRHERIRAFLKLADDLWMRKQALNRFLPRWPGR